MCSRYKVSPKRTIWSQSKMRMNGLQIYQAKQKQQSTFKGKQTPPFTDNKFLGSRPQGVRHSCIQEKGATKQANKSKMDKWLGEGDMESNYMDSLCFPAD